VTVNDKLSTNWYWHISRH